MTDARIPNPPKFSYLEYLPHWLASLIVLGAIVAGVCVARGEDLPAEALPQPIIEVYFAPGPDCEDHAIAEIGKAKTSIEVEAYGLTSDRIADALIKAESGSTVVTIIEDAKAAQGKGCELSRCRDGGCQCYIDAKERIAHAKVIIIDGKTVCTGSYNWTNAARRNHENMLVIHDVKIAAEYEANFEKHRAHSEALK